MLRNTTVTGGDTGAHVWFPDFLIDHFLPWRVAGWSNDFYAGFPAGQFYFPFPAVLIAILDVVLPYNIAFKLVTALGPVALPVGAYVFGRGIRVPRPAAPLFAVAATAFLFFKDGGDATMTFDFHIMGGTLASTLAGEYSFMIALALSLFFLGTLARALDRRGPDVAARGAARAHGHEPPRGRDLRGRVPRSCIWLDPPAGAQRRPGVAAIGAVGVLLTAFWLLPLAVNLGNTTDMRYEPIGDYLDWMFLSENWFLYPFAVLALGAGIWYRRRATLDRRRAHRGDRAGLLQLGRAARAPGQGAGLEPAAAPVLVPHAVPARGAGRRRAGAARRPRRRRGWSRGRRNRRSPPASPPADDDRPRYDDPVPPATAVAPVARRRHVAARDPGDRDRGAGGDRDDRRARARAADDRDFLPYWARYNYTGYESGTADDFTAKSWPEYRAFLDTANSLAPRSHGVGGRRRHRRVRHAARAHAAAVLDRTAASSRWRASTSRRRRRRRTTS